jgi:hypothetical protein
LNRNDIIGNTPLIFAIKLSGWDQGYQEILKEILKYSPDPFLKNSISGWSAMDESLS